MKCLTYDSLKKYVNFHSVGVGIGLGLGIRLYGLGLIFRVSSPFGDSLFHISIFARWCYGRKITRL